MNVELSGIPRVIFRSQLHIHFASQAMFQIVRHFPGITGRWAFLGKVVEQRTALTEPRQASPPL